MTTTTIASSSQRMGSERLQSIISLYNNTNKDTIPHRPLSSSHHRSSRHQLTQDSDSFEDCYRVNLDQWLSLGQPQPSIPSNPSTISPHHPSSSPSSPPVHPSQPIVSHPHLKPSPRPRSISLSPPPPIPPRRGNSSTSPPKTNHPRTIHRRPPSPPISHDRRRRNLTDPIALHHDSSPSPPSHPITHQHPPHRSSSTPACPPIIDLPQLRKSIEPLWIKLIIIQIQRLHHPPPSSIKSRTDYYRPNVKLSGLIIRGVWIRSGLDSDTLAQVWDSIDRRRSGEMNFDEFLLGTYEISKLRQQHQRRGTRIDRLEESDRRMVTIKRQIHSPSNSHHTPSSSSYSSSSSSSSSSNRSYSISSSSDCSISSSSYSNPTTVTSRNFSSSSSRSIPSTIDSSIRLRSSSPDPSPSPLVFYGQDPFLDDLLTPYKSRHPRKPGVFF